MVDFMVPRIGPITPLLLLVDHFGPIRDTMESTVAAKGIEKVVLKILINLIHELETVPWYLHVTSLLLHPKSRS